MNRATHNLPSHALKTFLKFLFCFLVFNLYCSCKQPKATQIEAVDIVKDMATINASVQNNIEDLLDVASESKGVINDSLNIIFYPAVQKFYSDNSYVSVWSDSGKCLPRAYSLLSYFENCKLDGLFKQDYHFKQIQTLKYAIEHDSLSGADAMLWAKWDVIFTDAFMHIVGDLSQGRLQADSSSWKYNSKKLESVFLPSIKRVLSGESIKAVFESVQPSITAYRNLRSEIAEFVDSMDTFKYTYVQYPRRMNIKEDSLNFLKVLNKRLKEPVMQISLNTALPDSATLSESIKKYQKQHQLKTDGKISEGLIRHLNNTDVEKYLRIAINLDRLKSLPDTMPKQYIFVNIPSYYLSVFDSDSIALTSRIICGKPITPTPEITSAISDLVIFPTWTVPQSIIKKEMLPALKRNSGYLARKGLFLYNYKGQRIDATTVNWSKYSKGIPYKIQQGSGDDNALGVIKFNFKNPFSVYLHDTNQRYLFSNKSRALSHGCVRVQEWQKLASIIIKNDSLNLTPGDTLRFNYDTMMTWINKKEMHRIGVKFQFPLFIRYISCESINEKLRFYEDVYGEDKKLKEKYFQNR